MAKDNRLKIANLRFNVLKLALSDRTGKLALLRMFEAGTEGRKEASEIGMKKASRTLDK